MSKIFEIVRPESLNDSAYEDYEYLIRWMGRDGSEYLLMFMDAELQNRVNNSVINKEDTDTIEALIENVGRSVNLTANDLSKNDLSIIGQLFENRYVTRILKSGETERFAPDGNSYRFRLSELKYEVSFRLTQGDIKSWK